MQGQHPGIPADTKFGLHCSTGTTFYLSASPKRLDFLGLSVYTRASLSQKPFHDIERIRGDELNGRCFGPSINDKQVNSSLTGTYFGEVPHVEEIMKFGRSWQHLGLHPLEQVD